DSNDLISSSETDCVLSDLARLNVSHQVRFKGRKRADRSIKGIIEQCTHYACGRVVDFHVKMRRAFSVKLGIHGRSGRDRQCKPVIFRNPFHGDYLRPSALAEAFEMPALCRPLASFRRSTPAVAGPGLFAPAVDLRPLFPSPTPSLDPGSRPCSR